ncbi:MAG: crossover junction endodeoxyribonuclease RuvC [Desulfovibrionaceae bacterium]|nr:crossover junction endodeoxyribonuclease RuvC [Desulfovibrionaceae bacterium]
MEPVTVIGIDPGSVRTGWGVVRVASSGYELVDCGLIKTTSDASRDFCQRLAVIYHELTGVLERTRPQEAAIEQVFMAKNAATAFKLGQARGVAVAACAARGLPVMDYEPTLVKKTLVGTGGAEKEQVAFMVRCRLGLRSSDWALDTSDALAIALTHLSLRRFRQMAQAARKA